MIVALFLLASELKINVATHKCIICTRNALEAEGGDCILNCLSTHTSLIAKDGRSLRINPDFVKTVSDM